METIEIGMYCYIKNFREYGIGIIDCILDNNLCVIDCQHNAHTASCDNVIASHNIINLIEVGDYVNGYRVYSLENIKEHSDLNSVVIEKTTEYSTFERLFEQDIKSVLTYECFKNNCYKVGD